MPPWRDHSCASAAESLCLGQNRRPEIAEALQGLGEDKAEVFLTLAWHLEPSVAGWGKSDLLGVHRDVALLPCLSKRGSVKMFVLQE